YELLTGKHAPLSGHSTDLSGPLGEVLRLALASDRRTRIEDLKQLEEAVEGVQPRPKAEGERNILLSLRNRSSRPPPEKAPEAKPATTEPKPAADATPVANEAKPARSEPPASREVSSAQIHADAAAEAEAAPADAAVTVESKSAQINPGDSAADAGAVAGGD